MVYGLGKNRSKFGRYLDGKGITQEEIVKGGLSRNAVSRLCSGDQDPEKLHLDSKIKAVSVLRRLGYDVRISDFW